MKSGSGAVDGSTSSVNTGLPNSPEGFTCMDGTLLEKSWRCDGVPDCPHQEDELHCGMKSLLYYNNNLMTAEYNNVSKTCVYNERKMSCQNILDH